MWNPIGGRTRAVCTLGAFVVASGAVATASCTYDYQGALGTTTSDASSGGASSSSSASTHPSTSSAGGSGGSGGAAGATQSSSTGGPVACPPLAGQLTKGANDASHGQVPWKPCGMGSMNLTENLRNNDLAVDCVALTPSKYSEWLRVSFAFDGLPADAAVTKIVITIQRGASMDLKIEDRHAWIQPLTTLEMAEQSVGPWPQTSTSHDYTLDKTYLPGEVTGAELVLQVLDLSNNDDVTAKVGWATAAVSYNASVCP